MKKILKFLLAISVWHIPVSSFSQNFDVENIVWDENENTTPLYYQNQIIIKFNPAIINISAINDTSIHGGVLSDFIDSATLQLIIDSGYFDSTFANLNVWKMYRDLTTDITTSETRIGETIEMPEFWSTFLIEWDNATGFTFDEAIDSLNRLDPYIEFAHPNYVVQLTTLPNDYYFTNGDQAGLYTTTSIPNANINIDPAWDLTVGSDNCRVSIHDTGINWDHSDFSQDNSGTWSQSRVKGGWDWIHNQAVNASTTMDDNGHGSACASIVGAISNNNRGVAGIAGGNGGTSSWGVSLYAMKVFDGSSGDYSSIYHVSDAIVKGATGNASFGNAIHVMSNSYRLHKNDAWALIQSIKWANLNKVVFVVASGNYPATGVTSVTQALYPASYRDDWVMKVGANDATGDRASFSVYGNGLDFIAPGTNDIYQAVDHNSNSTYTYSQDGTSFACPHAAGVAALMVSYINGQNQAPNKLTHEDVESIMQRYSTDIPGTPLGYDATTGFGRIDAGRTISGIRFPRFEVKHYQGTIINSTAVKISTNVQLIVSQKVNGLPAGTYYGDVYQIVESFPISQPSGRTILDVWERNSSSTLLGTQPITGDAGYSVFAWNQSTVVTVGYIFQIKLNAIGQTLNQWIPSSGLNGTSTVAWTVYSEDPTATSVNNVAINKELIRIYPNPAHDQCTISFGLLKDDQVGIEVMDFNGRVVRKIPAQTEHAGHKEYSIDLAGLGSGIYFCSIVTSDGKIVRKLSVIH